MSQCHRETTTLCLLHLHTMYKIIIHVYVNREWDTSIPIYYGEMKRSIVMTFNYRKYFDQIRKDTTGNTSRQAN